MEPTLHCARPGTGCEAHFSDRVLANRFIYHFRDPKRGEIIVFKTPGNKPVCSDGKVGETFTAGKLGKYTIVKGPDGRPQVILGPPFTFDKTNVAKFNF